MNVLETVLSHLKWHRFIKQNTQILYILLLLQHIYCAVCTFNIDIYVAIFFLLRFNNHEVCFRKVNWQSVCITPYFHFLSSELTKAFTSSSSWLSWLLFCSVSTPRFPYINDYRAVEVVSTDRKQWGLYTRLRSRFSHTNWLSLVNTMFIIWRKQGQFNSFNVTCL